jgi:dCTP deaminase
MHGILTDKIILAAIEAGTIKIDPFNHQQLNPVSYDVTLGDQVTLYRRWVLYSEGGASTPDGRYGHAVYPRGDSVLDAKEEPETVSFQIDPEKGWLLRPGIGYLMHTRERIWTERYVPILDGKSSIGRLFIQIHATAGFGDPGFDGQYTLEVIAQHPVRVYPGMRIGQIRFHTMHGEVSKTYDKVGHYTGKAAQGAVGSQAWRQFKK